MYIILVIINRLFQLYSLALLVYVLISWFPAAQGSKLAEILGRLCEPYLSIFDKFVPTIGGISFSPVVGLIALQFIQNGFNYIFTSFFGFLLALV